MACFNIDYLGTTVVDKRFSNPMGPWVIADIRRRKKVQKVRVLIEATEVVGMNQDGLVVFRHQLQHVTRFCHEPNNMRLFMYLVRDETDPVLHCYLFRAQEFEDVVEIFQTMKENIRENPPGRVPLKSHSSAASLTSLCADISPSSSQFFEVLYVGKIKVSHRKVPNTFIDDALEKIRLHEVEKHKKLIQPPGDGKSDVVAVNGDFKRLSSDNVSVTSGDRSSDEKHSGDVTGINQVCDISDRNFVNGNVTLPGDAESIKSDAEMEKVRNEIGYRRGRTGSLGVIESYKRKNEESSHNRTMLFYVGRSDLRLISPDKKQVLLNKQLKDVTSCIQGMKNHEHFGFIIREMDGYVAYVFKGESECVAEDVVSAITQSFHANKDQKECKQPVLSCDHCPMVWYHKLCAEIEGLSEKNTQMAILKRIESLPVEEQDVIHTKFLGAESSDIKEQIEFLMILLRAHCETKQTRHVHDTAENRSEFLNQYLGGSTIFMKAKRSLTSSFDQLLKRKGSHLDISSSQSNSKESLHRKSDSSLNECDGNRRSSSDVDGVKKEMKKMINDHQNEAEQLKRQFQKEKSVEGESKSQGKKSSFPEIAALTINNQKIEKAILQSSAETEECPDDDISKTPMINIFLKVGSTPKTTPPHDRLTCDGLNQTPSGSWRQAIFNRVVTPGKPEEREGREYRRRTREELRDLWKKAINQQLLLIRMEKENARLRARQEEATVKRIKLEYDELNSSCKEYMGIWDLISNKDNRINSSKCDSQMLMQAIRQGVPRAKRGDIWHFLAVQFCLKQPPFDSTGFPNYDMNYEDLLKQLTSFQHAILIDLGRTFPNHPYFASPLGPGQLALFNLLKAYSLLDPQVGYCQGLSFVAGVLLLHMSEETAFLLLRHLMFRRGLRKQYLPDMAALQVQLYQLSRLLHDTFPKLYAHFDRNEIAPTLYAASWILTLFASQFPLGFVTRVFDLIFLENTPDIIFRVIMALLEEHKDALLKKTSFEEIMDYLKNDVPKMDNVLLERIMKKVITMDISKHLHEYEVEYHVLQEEMATPRPEIEQLRRLELENRRLTDQNLALIEQLEVVNKNTNRLEKSRTNQQATINRLETQIRNLEITIATLGDFIADIGEEYRDIEIPGDIRRIITNLELAEQRSTKQLRNEQNLKKKLEKNAFLKRSKTSMGFYEKTQPSSLEELYTVDDLPEGTKFGERQPAKDEKREENTKAEPVKPPVLRGVPLKVIVDDEDERRKIHYSSPNLTSKITSGVSSFFNSSHNQIIKNQKNKKFFQDNLFVANGKTNEGFSDEAEPVTRQFSSEIGSLNIKDSIINTQKKDRIIKSKDNKLIELSESNHFDGTSLCKPNSAPVVDSAMSHIHPLDTCNDVNITYNGTTKLKSLKPGHRFNRHNTIDLIPINHDFLRIREDYSEPVGDKSAIDKKILEVFDSVTEKF